jgi:Flp pilus assembly protein TadG
VVAVHKRWIRRGALEERGQTLVMVGIMLFVLLGIGAMALDVGEVLWSRGTQQNAADAAALAGVRALPDNPALAEAAAIDYAGQNGFQTGVNGVTVTATVSSIAAVNGAANNALTVTITRVVPAGLRAAVGAGDITVPAQAVAVVAAALPLCDVWPWAIEKNTLLYGEDGTIYNSGADGLPYGKKVILKVPPQNQVTSGNFLAVRPLGKNEGGTSKYVSNIKNGACIPSVETIWTEPGNFGANTGKAVLTEADSAIKQSEPCYNATTKSPDSVYWEVSATKSFTSPLTGDVTTLPFALGGPAGNSPCGNDNGNTGPPSAADPFPAIVLPSTTRVGIIAVLEEGTYSKASGNSGSFEAKIDGFAAFYLIGLETVGPHDYVVGAFLERAVAKAGTPLFGRDLTGLVSYFLWQ